MIKEIQMYTVICDNCGKDANDGCEYSGWNDMGFTEDSAVESGYLKQGDKHYCPECFSYGDNDELILKTK